MSPLLCLAHAAGVTTRIRLATGLLILPYYHPVTLAREIQTLWHLSGGRFVLGVGPGWDQHEFESLGMRLGERGRRTDEMLAALRMLLTRRDVSFTGRYPDTLRYGHLNFAHLVDTTDREKALGLQRPIFERVMGTHRTFANLQQSYFLGTTHE